VKENPSMFVQPMMNYKSDEWLAMAYGIPPKIESNSRFMIGFVFKTEEYSREFLNLLRSYNNGKDIDDNNNIRISLIIEDPENYSVYVYPSHERDNVQNFQKEMEEKYGPGNEQLIVQLVMCKYFPYGETSTFKRFKDLYKEGNHIEITAFYLKNNQLQEIKGVKPITKTSIKIQHRKLLNKDDLEYQHLKKFKR
jgi:hypothetical protein